MSRFLTPSKIGLLVLIELYADGLVHRDAILEVLSFISSSLLEIDTASPRLQNGDRWKRAERAINLMLFIKDFEKLLQPYPVIAGLPGRRLWDLFLVKFWGIDSLDTLHTFFENLHRLLARTKEELRQLAELGHPPPEEKVRISRNSPFGAFIRRSQLEFNRLRFHDASELWKDFVRYRQPTAPYWKRRNPSFQKFSFDSVLLEGQHEWGVESVYDLAGVAYGDMLLGDNHSTLPVSTDDVERLLEFQIEQMQKFGTRLPTELRHQFEDILRYSRLVPSVSHYSSFLDAWKSGDYPTAFDRLHRYFDYTLQARDPHRGDRAFYQYALMNLAVLQADFGAASDAVAAMLETVATARENRDLLCLNFALNWLFHFGRAHPSIASRYLEAAASSSSSSSAAGSGVAGDTSALGGGNGRESMAFLRVKARETGMWTLWSSVLVSEAKLGLAAGESVAVAFERLARASQVLVERNMGAALGSQQLAVAAAVWDRLGVAFLSTAAAETFLRCHARSSPAASLLPASTGAAAGSSGGAAAPPALPSSSSSGAGNSSSGTGAGGGGGAAFDDELRMACRAASSLASRGRYDEAFARLEALDGNALRTAKGGQYWTKHRGIIQLRRDLHRGSLDAAEHLLAQLLKHRGDDAGHPELDFAVDLLNVDYLTRRKDYAVAMAAVEELIARVVVRDETGDLADLIGPDGLRSLDPDSGDASREAAADSSQQLRPKPPVPSPPAPDVQFRVTLLLAKARLLELSGGGGGGGGGGPRGFSLALRAAALAWRARLLPGLWAAVGQVSGALLALGDFAPAERLLAAVLPRALETDQAGLAAELYARLGDACMGLAGRAGGAAGGGKKRREWLARAMAAVERSFDHYSAVEDAEKQCEMMAKKATIMRVAGDMQSANGYAAAYADLRRQALAYARAG